MDAPQPRGAGDLLLTASSGSDAPNHPRRIEESIEYLEAKAAVDSRALNQRVWDGLWANIDGEPGRTLELGAGIGTMLERMLDAGRLRHGEYHAIDHNPRLLEHARQRLSQFAASRQWQLQPVDDGLQLIGDGVDLTVRFITADLTDVDWAPPAADYGLMLAHAVLDLVDLDSHLPRFLRWLCPGACAYFTLTFDGQTTFLPGMDPELDHRIERAYHASMEARQTPAGEPAGGPHGGRRLLVCLMESGAEIVEAGASDWVLVPAGGAYRPGEQSLLAWMLRTVEGALSEAESIPQPLLQRWLVERHQQLQAHRLSLIVHQLDVCARAPLR